MYSTCIFCHDWLGANQTIEQFPIGRRVGFDVTKGRLWAICRRCTRWNLAPIEERWEAIEECELLFRRATMRVAEGNIGIARCADGLILVRIGEPIPMELAIWRYSGRLGRRLRAIDLFASARRGSAGIAMAGGAIVLSSTVLGVGAAAYATAAMAGALHQDHRTVAILPYSGETVLHVRGQDLERTGFCDSKDPSLLVFRVGHAKGYSDFVGTSAVRRIESAGNPERFLFQASEIYAPWSRLGLLARYCCIRLRHGIAAHRTRPRLQTHSRISPVPTCLPWTLQRRSKWSALPFSRTCQCFVRPGVRLRRLLP